MKYSDILSIGQGAYFPIELTEVEGKTSWKTLSGDIKLINHNLISLFNTHIGELIRNEDFGNRLWECIDEPNTQALSFMIYRFCKDAISSWEKRIIFVDSEVSRGSDKLNIKLYYKLNQDQSVLDLDFSYNITNNTFSL